MYNNDYLYYKNKYLLLKQEMNGGEKKVRKSPSKSATLYKVGTIKTGNDGNKWIIVENKNGIKKWQLHKKLHEKLQLPEKFENVEEFEKFALQYAKDHIDEPGYEWMKTKQPDDYNIENYLDIKFEIIDDKTHISVDNKKIHPEYVLSFLFISIDNKSYKFDCNPKLMLNSYYKENGIHRISCYKKPPPYKLIINKNLKGFKVSMIGHVTSNSPGMLDIELEGNKIIK